MVLRASSQNLFSIIPVLKGVMRWFVEREGGGHHALAPIVKMISHVSNPTCGRTDPAAPGHSASKGNKYVHTIRMAGGFKQYGVI